MTIARHIHLILCILACGVSTFLYGVHCGTDVIPRVASAQAEKAAIGTTAAEIDKAIPTPSWLTWTRFAGTALYVIVLVNLVVWCNLSDADERRRRKGRMKRITEYRPGPGIQAILNRLEADHT